jgi:YggT family protein
MANIRIDPYNPAVRLLYSVTDPILEPLRRYTTIGMIDLSPLVALLLLDFLRQILVSMLV